MTMESRQIRKKRGHGIVQLAFIIWGVLMMWGVALPGLSRTQCLQSWHQRLEKQNVDASALYYADLEDFEPKLLLPLFNAQDTNSKSQREK